MQLRVGENDRPLEISAQCTVALQTGSGSVYRVVQDRNGRWWFSADNVPNPMSRALSPDTWWRIQRPEPWPPETGAGILLRAPDGLQACDQERVPGGGKYTFDVRVIRPWRR